jgi:hypothetical protein
MGWPHPYLSLLGRPVSSTTFFDINFDGKTNEGKRALASQMNKTVESDTHHQ